jgi:hypothetical protein
MVAADATIRPEEETLATPLEAPDLEKEIEMAKMLAMCGLDCATCPAFLAHQTNDQALREKTAAEWSQQFHVDLKPADINCVGCVTVQGVHIGHCGECEIRQCGLERKVGNCALCGDFACETVGKFLANVPWAKANLEEVRRTRPN